MCVLKERVFRSHAEHLGENYVNGWKVTMIIAMKTFFFISQHLTAREKFKRKLFFIRQFNVPAVGWLVLLKDRVTLIEHPTLCGECDRRSLYCI